MDFIITFAAPFLVNNSPGVTPTVCQITPCVLVHKPGHIRTDNISKCELVAFRSYRIIWHIVPPHVARAGKCPLLGGTYRKVDLLCRWSVRHTIFVRTGLRPSRGGGAGGAYMPGTSMCRMNFIPVLMVVLCSVWQLVSTDGPGPVLR
jgi:hypothetical protein